MSQKTNSSAYHHIDRLLDGGSFVELGAYITARSTDFNLADTPTPADGVITGYGTIGGKLVYVFSQDSEVLGGSVGEMHARKIVQLYDKAIQMGAPIIGLIDSAGLRLQESTDALHAFGQIYAMQAKASGVIPQILVIFGSCGGGLSIMASMADFVFMERNTAKLFITSPNAVLGNHVDKEDTANADFQLKESGVADFASDAEELFLKLQHLLSFLPSDNEDNDSYIECTDDLNRLVDIENVMGDSALILTYLSDNHEYLEVQKEYAPEMVTALIRLNGSTIGCIANRSKTYSDAGVEKEYKKALTAKGARKAASFVKFCDAFSLPILSLVDVDGFANHRCSEKHLARDAAQLVYAYCSANVPKVSLIMEDAIGTSSLLMGAKSVGADIVYALENSRIGMMDSKQAVKIMYAKESESSADAMQFLAEKAKQYDALQSSSLSAARRGYVDDIISLPETRKRLIASFEMLFTKKDDRILKKHGTV